MDTLPTELKDHICTFLKHPPDLANLARTSSIFLNLARRVLYQKLELASSLPTLQDTYNLLQREPSLARAVLSLNVVSGPGIWHILDESTWIDKRIFHNMASLRSITLDGIPCRPARNIQLIIDYVYRHCLQLKEISVINVSWPASSATRNSTWKTQLDVPSTLRRVTLKSSFSSDMRIFFASTFFNASNTINALELSLMHNSEVLVDIKTFMFPHLHTFIVTGFSPTASKELIDFLNAHPSIRNLSILDSEALDITGSKCSMLPNLLTISATPQFLAQLVKVCDSVKFVRCLTLDFSRSYNPGTATKDMMSTVSSFPRLKHCSVLHAYGPANTLDILENLSESQELEWWSGGFYYHDTKSLNQISSVLTSFPVLRRVDIFEWSTPPNVMSDKHLGGLQKMAECNPSLQRICLYMPHSMGHEIATVLNVHRKKGLKRVYQFVEDGPYIGDRRRVQLDTVEWQCDPSL